MATSAIAGPVAAGSGTMQTTGSTSYGSSSRMSTSNTTRRASDSATTTSMHPRRESLNIRAFLTTGEEDFYSAAVFDELDDESVDEIEAAFIRAQRAAFGAMEDAALAKALAESEREARAQRSTPSFASSSFTGTSRASQIASKASQAHARYALVSPTELGLPPRRHMRSDSSSSLSSASSYTSSTSASSTSTSSSSQVSTSASSLVSSSPPSSRVSPSISPPRHSTLRPSTPPNWSSAELDHPSKNHTTPRQSVAISPPSRPQNPKVPTSSSVPIPIPSSTSTNNGATQDRHRYHQHHQSSVYLNPPSISNSATSRSISSSASSLAHPASASGNRASHHPSSSSHARLPSTSTGSMPPTSATPPPTRSAVFSQPIPIPVAAPIAKATKPAQAMAAVVAAAASVVPPPRPRSTVQAPIVSSSPSARDLARGLISSSTAISGARIESQATQGKAQRTPAASPACAPASGETHPCSKCSKPLEIKKSTATTPPTEPFSHNFLRPLHVICSSCSANHCRGCFTLLDGDDGDAVVTRCAATCRGGKGCCIQECCPLVGMIAIEECLAALDTEFVATVEGAAEASSGHAKSYSSSSTSTSSSASSRLGAGRVNQSQQAFLDLLLSRCDRTTRTFETMLLRTVSTVHKWLQAMNASIENDDDDEDDEEDCTMAKLQLRESLHRVFSSSSLLSIVHYFLAKESVSDWIKFSDLYTALLVLLRRLVECGCASVLNLPVAFFVSSPLASGQGGAGGRGATIWEVVTRLEERTQPQLMTYASTIKFDATKERVHRLCDGIMWLVLQDLTE